MGPVTPTDFTPWLSLFGGVLIGLSAVIVMGAFGKIAGISGITKGLVGMVPGLTGPADRNWRLSFLLGWLLPRLPYCLPPVTFRFRRFPPIWSGWRSRGCWWASVLRLARAARRGMGSAGWPGCRRDPWSQY